ncbi:MAG: hypothetical protein EXS43_06215 [Opitutus sp.]|nr:hypothetical protein [Opitutus sp.]
MLLLLASAVGVSPLVGADSAATFILAAGNADNEAERLTELRALAARGEALFDEPTRVELAALLPVVEAWVEGRARAGQELARGEGETHRYLHQFF